MKYSSLCRQRLSAIGLLGLALLTYPLVGLPSGEWGGIPVVYFYLFTIWAGLILLAASVAERQGK